MRLIIKFYNDNTIKIYLIKGMDIIFNDSLLTFSTNHDVRIELDLSTIETIRII